MRLTVIYSLARSTVCTYLGLSTFCGSIGRKERKKKPSHEKSRQIFSENSYLSATVTMLLVLKSYCSYRWPAKKLLKPGVQHLEYLSILAIAAPS